MSAAKHTPEPWPSFNDVPDRRRSNAMDGGEFVGLGRASYERARACVNLLAPHPDLSAVEVVSKDGVIAQRLYADLAKKVIGRIMAADVKCDPPTDIDLRTHAIIAERDALRATNEKLREALQDVLDGIGALSNPNNLDGYGISDERCAEILALASTESAS